MFKNTLIIVGILFFIQLLGMLAFILFSRKKIPQGKAGVRTGYGGIKVKFDSIFVFPFIHRWELMDISPKHIQLSRKNEQGLICKDNVRADIEVDFSVRINDTPADVELIAKTVGCAQASEKSYLVKRFEDTISEALKTAAKQFDFKELNTSGDKFEKEVVNSLAQNMGEYKPEGCKIVFLKQSR